MGTKAITAGQIAEILKGEIFHQFNDNELDINQQISIIVDLREMLDEFLEKNKHLEETAIIYKENGIDVEQRITKSEFYKIIAEIKNKEIPMFEGTKKQLEDLI